MHNVRPVSQDITQDVCSERICESYADAFHETIPKK